MNADIFLLTLLGLYVAHRVGDFWVQTSHQAQHKGDPGVSGVRACAAHVGTLTLTKIFILGVQYALTDMYPDPIWLIVGLSVDAISHYWADRRTTLENLAVKLRKHEFYQIGRDTVHIRSAPGSHLGGGSHALDQAFHVAFLWVGAVLISL